MRRSALLPAALVALITACSSGDRAPVPAAVANAATPPPSDEAKLVEEIAQNLQACSYDGAPVHVGADRVTETPPSDCRDMVAQIMRHTGLPQNFDVVSAPVPNAAAIVLL